MVDVILRGLTGNIINTDPDIENLYQKVLSQNGPHFIIAFFLIYNLLNAFTASFQVNNIKITSQENQAMEWVSKNTPIDSQYIVLSFGDPLNTPLQEWFPAITGRKNVFPVQGYEWMGAEEILKRRKILQEMEVCLSKTIECVETLAKSHNIAYDFILIHSGYVGEETQRNYELHFGEWMVFDLQNRDSYQKIYQKEFITIFERLK